MTLRQARALLCRYYAAMDRAAALGERVSSWLAGPVRTKTPASPVERAAILRAAILLRWRYVTRALDRLGAQHRRWVELRFGRNLSIQVARREMGLGYSEARDLENQALAAFIVALGERVEAEPEESEKRRMPDGRDDGDDSAEG